MGSTFRWVLIMGVATVLAIASSTARAQEPPPQVDAEQNVFSGR